MTCMHKENTNWVFKIHGQQVPENNSTKLVIILQYKKFRLHFDHCITFAKE